MANLLEFWGLRLNPFVPKTRCLDHPFAAVDFKEAKNRARRAAHEEGLNLLIGNTGSGVSYTAGCIKRELEAEQYTVKQMTALHMSTKGNLKLLCEKVGADPRGKVREALIRAIQDRALALKEQKRPLFLIIDNAHNLPGELLEDLPYIAAMDDPPVNLMSIMLCGTKELDRNIRRFEALNSRVTDYYTMCGLTASETHAYVKDRLKEAGAQKEIMTEEALDLLYESSASGNYRILNNLMNDALYLGAIHEKQMIDRNVMYSAVAHRYH